MEASASALVDRVDGACHQRRQILDADQFAEVVNEGHSLGRGIAARREKARAGRLGNAERDQRRVEIGLDLAGRFDGHRPFELGVGGQRPEPGQAEIERDIRRQPAGGGVGRHVVQETLQHGIARLGIADEQAGQLAARLAVAALPARTPFRQHNPLESDRRAVHRIDGIGHQKVRPLRRLGRHLDGSLDEHAGSCARCESHTRST